MAELTELEARKAKLELEHQVAVLEHQVRSAELVNSMVLAEDWGDPVNTREYLDDDPSFGSFSGYGGGYQIARPEDRRRGDFAPFWRTEAEHARIRGTARIISTLDEVGISALENLKNYVIGTGLTYRFAVNEAQPPTGDLERLAAQAQNLTDRFIEDNCWWGEGEREVFERSRRDGEFHLTLYDDLGWGGIPRLRIADPSFVTEPDRPRALEEYLGLGRSGADEALDWKYGHACPWNRTDQTEWLFVSWYGDDADWEAVPASRFVHGKLNVDREVKRGLSDYYPVLQNLENADKLLQNTLTGAAVQAAIAYIREHATGLTPDQIAKFVSGRADNRRTQSTRLGSRTDYSRRMRAGTVVDLPQTAKYHAGPLGTPRGQTYIEILQAALRIVGCRWQMPEYMISGDASNGNFASVLVAEAPFTKSAEAKQTFYCRRYADLVWKVIGLCNQAGLFPVPVKRAKMLLSLTVTGPDIAVRNRLEDHQIRKEENEAGILSLDTWAAEAGRDLAEEQSKGAEPKPEPQPPVIGQGGQGDAEQQDQKDQEQDQEVESDA